MDKHIDWPALKASATAGLNRIAYQNHDANFVLQLLAWFSLQNKAGFQMPAPPSHHTEAPKEVISCITTKASAAFETLIKRGNQAGVLEFIQLCLRHRRRLSPALLPLFLDWALRHPIRSEDLWQLCGERGPWLAAQHPNWQVLLPIQEGVWETGTLAEQLAWLSQLRRQSPHEARELIAQRQSSASVNEWKQLLSCLQLGLNKEDEPLLAKALHHKRKEIRQLAALLLAYLPKSQFQENLQVFARQLISYDKQLLSQQLSIHLSDTHAEELKTFTLDQAPVPEGKLGTKTRQLAQLFSLVPLSFWEGLLVMKPESIIQLAIKCKVAEWLIPSWIMSAVHHRDERWAADLLHQYWELHLQHPEKLPQPAAPYFEALASMLNEKSWQNLLQKQFSQLRELNSLGQWIQFMLRYKRPIPIIVAPAFAQKIVVLCQPYSQNRAYAFHHSLLEIRKLVAYFPPASYPRVAQIWAFDPYQHDWYIEHLEAALKHLAFRYELHQEFESENP